MIKLITDSTSYIPEEVAKKEDIKIIRLHTIVGDKDFVEGYPGTFQDIYDELERLKVPAKTSQPAIQDFIDTFNDVIDDGNEAIMLTISLTLSGTPNTARLAKEQCKDPSKITVIDSGTTGQGMWGLIEEMQKMIAAGKSRDEIETRIEELKKTSAIFFIPESFDYLKRGGRIGSVTAVIGSLLHIKPIIGFTNGVLKNHKTCIGMTKSLLEIVKFVPKNAKKIFVLKISESQFFTKLKDIVIKTFPDVPVTEGDVGPVVGAHVGPAIGIAWVG